MTVSRGYASSLDGLRGIAIVMVLAFHFSVPGFNRGYLGVDVFFVISGFLITTLIVDEHRRTDGFRFSRFWMRRILRLLPLYYLYVAVCLTSLFVGVCQYKEGDWNVNRYIASLCFYFSNLGISNSIHRGGIQLTSHLWSLSIEEQFYLIWPVLCSQIIRRNAIWLGWLLAGATFVALQRSGSWDAAAFQLQTRGISLCAGWLAALYVTRDGRFKAWTRLRWTGSVAAIVAVAIFGVLSARSTLSDFWVFRFALPLLALTLAVFCSCLWTNREALASQVLSWSPLVYVGKISYGIYVWHMLCLVVATQLASGRLTRAIAAFGLTFVVAAVSYRLYEQPFLRLKEHFRT